MITYAVDANIISYFLCNNIKIATKVRAVVPEGNRIVIPNVVYYEVRRGLLSKFAPKKTITFNQFCKMFEVCGMNKETGEIAAKIYAKLKKQGRLVEDADILIAAFCIQNNYTLVTNNAKHFENIEDLLFVNWME